MPLLTARLTLAREHRHWIPEMWGNVARTYEERFMLVHANDRVRVWHENLMKRRIRLVNRVLLELVEWYSPLGAVYKN